MTSKRAPGIQNSLWSISQNRRGGAHVTGVLLLGCPSNDSGSDPAIQQQAWHMAVIRVVMAQRGRVGNTSSDELYFKKCVRQASSTSELKMLPFIELLMSLRLKVSLAHTCKIWVSKVGLVRSSTSEIESITRTRRRLWGLSRNSTETVYLVNHLFNTCTPVHI